MPVVTFIGFHSVGKTTVATAVVGALRRRGLRVGVLKSTKEPRGETDRTGTDTFRYREAGAEPVALWAGEEAVVYYKAPPREEFWAFVWRHFADCDLVVAEGFKTMAFLPKIEVVRRDLSPRLLAREVPGVVALVADFSPGVNLPTFAPEDTEGLADFIRERFVRSFSPRVSLLVDGRPVGLNRYVRSALAGVVRGFLGSLRGLPHRFSRVEVRLEGSED